MSRLRSALDRIREDTGGHPHAWVVWRQSIDGSDAYTSPSAPGETLTADELDARPEALGVVRILVRRVDVGAKGEP